MMMSNRQREKRYDGYKINRLCLLLSVLCFVPVFPQAEAHDVWITTVQEGAALRAIVHHGHPGDRKMPEPDKLFEFNAIGNRRHQQSLLSGITRAVQNGMPVLMTEPLTMAEMDSLMVVARYDNGYWVKTSHGHRNTSKLRVPDAEDSLSSMKYAKALIEIGSESSALYEKAVGHRLELIPLSNPFSLKPGDALKIRVQFDGKPLAGVSVEIGDGETPMEETQIPRYPTDELGIAAVPISKSGLQLIVVDYRVASSHPDLAALELHNATLSFVLPSTESR
jgi:nickel transport protein